MVPSRVVVNNGRVIKDVGVKTTVLYIVKGSQSTRRKETTNAARCRLKRDSSFWRLPCVMLVGVLINPVFGLAAAVILSLDRNNEGRLQQKRNRQWRRIGIGLIVTGIITSLWICSAVFIYHFAVYYITNKFAGHEYNSWKEVERTQAEPTGEFKKITIPHVTQGAELFDSTDNFASSRTQKLGTMSPVTARQSMMPYSKGPHAEATSTPDTLFYTSKLSSNMDYSKSPTSAGSISHSARTDLFSSSSTRSTYTTPTSTSSRVQHPGVFHKTAAIIQRSTTKSIVTSTTAAETTTLSSYPLKANLLILNDEEAYAKFLEAMKKFAGN